MNERSFDQLLDAWMDLGPTSAPDRVADAARLEARTTRQRPAFLSRWATRRFPEMNNMVRVGLVAAAVVAATLLGYSYFIAPNVGGPGPDDPAPTPAASQAAALLLSDQEGLLSPGLYSVDDVITADIILTVPSGWQKNVAPGVVWTPNSEAALGFFTGDDMPPEACDGTALPAIGPTVDDYVSALESAPGFEVGEPTPVTVDGYSGTHLDLTATCPEGLDDHTAFWILDVDGERLVISANDRPGAIALAVSQMEAMVDSLQIEP